MAKLAPRAAQPGCPCAVAWRLEQSPRRGGGAIWKVFQHRTADPRRPPEGWSRWGRSPPQCGCARSPPTWRLAKGNARPTVGNAAPSQPGQACSSGGACRGQQLRVFDGKKMRTCWHCRAMAVVYDPAQRTLVCDIVACEDAHESELPLIERAHQQAVGDRRAPRPSMAERGAAASREQCAPPYGPWAGTQTGDQRRARASHRSCSELPLAARDRSWPTEAGMASRCGATWSRTGARGYVWSPGVSAQQRDQDTGHPRAGQLAVLAYNAGFRSGSSSALHSHPGRIHHHRHSRLWADADEPAPAK